MKKYIFAFIFMFAAGCAKNTPKKVVCKNLGTFEMVKNVFQGRDGTQFKDNRGKFVQISASEPCIITEY